MKKLCLFIGSLLLSITTSYATDVIKEGEEYPIEKIREQNQQILKMVVEEISKTLPQTVDKYTKMIHIRDENLTLIYTFAINTGAKSDEAVIKEDRERMQKAVTKGICQSSKRFLDAGINLSYEYQSAVTQQRLFSFYVTQATCKGLSHD